MKVIVLGSGLMGVTSAYFLAKAGHQVTVIDKNSDVGMGCSYGNGGQLSYCHVETWAYKASLLSMIKAAITPYSFLSVSDYKNKKFWRWFFEFCKNSSTKKAQENSRRLFRLSSYSKDVLKEIVKEEDLKFAQKNTGTLHFYRRKRSFEKAIKELEFLNSLGCQSQILTAEECVAKEPTLVKLLDEKRLAGGILFKQDSSGNSNLFAKSLAKVCAEKYGVVFEHNTEIKNLLTNYEKITGVNTSKGVFVGDKYVYALGANGIKLLYGINIDPKIYPLKGHSLSVPSDIEFVAPNMALTDPERKIVYSRIGKTFRAAGTVEAVGFKNGVNNGKIEFLKNSIRSTFSDFGNFNEVQEWCGFRPFRPNSLPLICEVQKYQNLFLNTGHGSLGWTLSAASGKVLSDLISGNPDKNFGFLEEEAKDWNKF